MPNLNELSDQDRKLVHSALSFLEDGFEKAAKAAKAVDEHREAVKFEGRKQYIEEDLAPLFHVQEEIFGEESDAAARAGLANILFEQLKGAGLTGNLAETADRIAEKMLAFATQVYARGYAHGEVARDHRTASVVIRSLPALRHGEANAGVAT